MLAWASTIGMALIVFMSLLRQGPRGFMGQISSLWPLKHKHSEEEEPHSDEHHDHEGHEHEVFTAAPAKRSMLRVQKRPCGCGADDCGK